MINNPYHRLKNRTEPRTAESQLVAKNNIRKLLGGYLDRLDETDEQIMTKSKRKKKKTNEAESGDITLTGTSENL